MPKKNQSKSDKKVLTLNNQKKPLPKPDTNLRQTMYKRKNKDTGQLIKESTKTQITRVKNIKLNKGRAKGETS